MASAPVRDPLADHLITFTGPTNAPTFLVAGKAARLILA
jgi:hypothetical protein